MASHTASCLERVDQADRTADYGTNRMRWPRWGRMRLRPVVRRREVLHDRVLPPSLLRWGTADSRYRNSTVGRRFFIRPRRPIVPEPHDTGSPRLLGGRK